MRTAEATQPEPGSALGLSFAPESVHWFDPQSTQRID
ncbi:MAG: hypothetical protein ACK58C_01485 [Betaproteobacteria bacterium]